MISSGSSPLGEISQVLGRKKGPLEVVGGADQAQDGEEAEETLAWLGCGWGVPGLAVPLRMIGDSSSNCPYPSTTYLLASPESWELGAEAPRPVL